MEILPLNLHSQYPSTLAFSVSLPSAYGTEPMSRFQTMADFKGVNSLTGLKYSARIRGMNDLKCITASEERGADSVNQIL